MDHEITEVAYLWMGVPRLQGSYHRQLSRGFLYACDLVDPCNQPFVNFQIHLHSASPSMLPGSQSSVTGRVLRRTIVRSIEARCGRDAHLRQPATTCIVPAAA